MKPGASYNAVLLKTVLFWLRLSLFCKLLVNTHALNLTAELEHLETKPSFVFVNRRAVDFSTLYFPVALVQLMCMPSHCWNTMEHCSSRFKIELKFIWNDNLLFLISKLWEALQINLHFSFFFFFFQEIYLDPIQNLGQA